jgi:hypothetical protein
LIVTTYYTFINKKKEHKQNQTMMMMMNKKTHPFLHIASTLILAKEEDQLYLMHIFIVNVIWGKRKVMKGI